MSNSALLNSGTVGNIGLNHMREVRKQVQTKWDSTGFLAGLEGHIKENMAQLYENQASSLLTESSGAASAGSFETVVFPIVRRVFSKLLANDIVSVQAMNLPIGKLFFFIPQTSSRVDAAGNPGNPYGPDSKYNDWVGGTQFSAHTGMDQLPECVGLGDCIVTPYMAKNLYDIFYNDGLFDNSKGALTIVATSTLPQVMDSSGEFSAVTSGFPAATDGTIREMILAVSGFTGGAGSAEGHGRLTGPDGNNMDTESFLASLHVVNVNGAPFLDPDGNTVIADDGEIPFRVVTQKYGKGIVDYTSVCDDAGVIYLGLDLTHPVAANGTSTFDGYVGISGSTAGVTAGIEVSATTFVIAWAEYASLEFETEMGEVTFTLDEVVVSVEERKLRATWSPELA